MRVSVERMRRWLLAGAILLVLVIAGFLGYAHYRAHRFLAELPKKLGADIRQETNAYTWSQTVKGHTVFTVHAAKAIQHNDGKYTLHDVGIAVYGKGSTRGDRVDRIYGKEFDLDQAEGVVRAIGEVHLDLEAPMATDATGRMDYAAGKDLKTDGTESNTHEMGRGDARLIHVKTSGLVYLQKLGIAATDEDIEFEFNGLTGHAKGAEYDADNGVLTLQSAVKVSGLEKGQPVLLNAARAELNRVSHEVVLSQAKYVTLPAKGTDVGTRQTVEAQHAVVTMRNDGSAERLEGDGGVTLTGGDGSQLTADRGEVSLGATSKPQSMRLTGHLRYTSDDAARQATGDATEARVAFDKAGHAEKVLLDGGVHLQERLSSAGKVASQRDLSAAMVELGMIVNEAGRSLPRDAKASGAAQLKVVDVKTSRTSSMAADVLIASFIRSSGQQRLDTVKGEGQTTLSQVSETGVVETSSGDFLDVRFRHDGGKPQTTGSGVTFAGGDAIASAVQQSRVVLTRKSVTKPGVAAQTDKATGAKVTYDGTAQTVSLSGGIELVNSSGTMWADHALLDQKTGDATIDGPVKASYRQGTQGEMVHVLADKAVLKKATDTAVFYGSPGKLARLWQGGSQVEAPKLELAQRQGRLVAEGDGSKAEMAVHVVLVSARTPNGVRGSTAVRTSDAQKGVASLHTPAVVRIASREMVYSNETRTAEFSGGVKIESADGVMRGQRATAYLEGAAPSRGVKNASVDAGAGFLGGNVERVVVSGAIEIEQPGRHATGEQLAYTASDGLFVLTGTQVLPPRVTDQARGSVSGAELRFYAQDESVVISNGEANGVGQRIHTETKVKRER
jgi:lipopolysaccharide export system protein LptA